MIAEKTAPDLFANWNAVIEFLGQLSWKNADNNHIHIWGLRSGEWQVRINRKEDSTQIRKNVKSGYGIGLHDLSW